MKGDFTRSTFSHQKHYTSVRMQQGRLQLDSDWNEQVDIQQHLQNAQAVDVIGSTTGVSTVDIQTGLPTDEAFKLREINDKNGARDIAIIPGHLYVYGTLCELARESDFTVELMGNKKIKVESLIVDDRPFAENQWLILHNEVERVQEQEQTAPLNGAKIIKIDAKSRELTLSQDISQNIKKSFNVQIIDSTKTNELTLKVSDSFISDPPLKVGEELELINDGNDKQSDFDSLIFTLDKIEIIHAEQRLTLKALKEKDLSKIQKGTYLRLKRNHLSLRRIITYGTQPDYPNPTPLDPLKSGEQYLAYIDVCQRHITALDDPTIRDIALNVPDTTTRTKTVWQLKLKSLSKKEIEELVDLQKEEKQAIAKNQVIENQWLTLSEEEKKTLDDKAKKQKIAEKWDALPETEKQKILQPEERQKILQEAEKQKIWDNFWQEERDRNPQLTASMKNSQINGRSINIQQLGNQLYRVEIHHGSRSETGATFKWSRNNGTIASSIQSIQNDVIKIKRSIQDAWSDSEPGQWIEIITEEMELKGEPGILVSLKQINETTLKFDDAHVRTQLTGILGDQGIPKSPAKVRRWDYTTSTKTVQGAISIQQNSKNISNIPIESGIQVTFAQGQEYRTGDYWLIPARTNSNDIEWPKDSEGRSIPQGRRGIKHNYSLLAVINQDSTIQDKRVLFTPLFYVNTIETNLNNHVDSKQNPHHVTATQIDTEGGTNQIINCINDNTNTDVKIKIEQLDEKIALKTEVLSSTGGTIRGSVKIINTVNEEVSPDPVSGREENTVSPPSALLNVEGNIKAHNLIFPLLSSEIKENISDLLTKDNNEILNQLNPVKFNFNNEENK